MTAIIILILVGLLLFAVEFLLIPGITIAGIGAVGCLIGAVYWAYAEHGTSVGSIVLISTLVLTLATIVFSLRAKTWKRFMLNTNVEGNVVSDELDQIQPGDQGITVSRLTPMGKAKIKDIILEAKSTGTYIDQKTPIEVIRMEGSVAIVKPK